MRHVVCDLDGVLYRGNTEIPGSGRALARFLEAGGEITFVTNNSTKTPEATAEKIRAITGVAVTADQVATSSQAAASVLDSDDDPVMVFGEEGVRAAVTARGLSTTDDPNEARSLVVGMYWGVTYDDLARAAEAARGGARFVATNNDPTYPVEEGLLPGAGALVAAIATASGRNPEIAGKPHRPLRDLLRSRGIAEAWVVGDRMDTDIALAGAEPGWQSILVRTGVTDAALAGDDADVTVEDFAEAVDHILESARS